MEFQSATTLNIKTFFSMKIRQPLHANLCRSKNFPTLSFRIGRNIVEKQDYYYYIYYCETNLYIKPISNSKYLSVFYKALFSFTRINIRGIRTITKFRLLTKIDFNVMHLIDLCKIFLAKIANSWLKRPPKLSNLKHIFSIFDNIML